MELPRPSSRVHPFPLLLTSLIALGCSSSRTSAPGSPIARPDAAQDTGAGSGTGPSAADWTMLGYDLASTYWNQAETKISAKSARSLVEAWSFDGAGGVTSTPVISAGRAYVLSQGLFALDLATGKPVWTNPDGFTCWMTGANYLACASFQVNRQGSVLVYADNGGGLRQELAAPVDQVWRLVIDPDRMVTCLPGGRLNS